MKKNIKIAWIEDSLDEKEDGQLMANRYTKEHDVTLEMCFFSNAEDFLKTYDFSYQLVLMDIKLPGINGIEAARKLRQIDANVILMFITNLSQLAYKGYEVDALDYILKPLVYDHFSLKMNRALSKMTTINENNIVIPSKNGLFITSIDDCMYIEVVGHNLIYHLTNQNIETSGSLKEVEKAFKKYDFMKCNNCYLVNPKYIKSIHKYDLEIGDEIILISHPRKKEFMDEFMTYMMKKR